MDNEMIKNLENLTLEVKEIKDMQLQSFEMVAEIHKIRQGQEKLISAFQGMQEGFTVIVETLNSNSELVKDTANKLSCLEDRFDVFVASTDNMKAKFESDISQHQSIFTSMKEMIDHIEQKVEKINLVVKEKSEMNDLFVTKINCIENEVTKSLRSLKENNIGNFKIDIGNLQNEKITKVIDERIIDMNERKKRERNVIIFNKSESINSGCDGQPESDESFVSRMLKVLQIDMNNSIESISRVGKFVIDKSRPIMLVCKSSEIKWKIIKENMRLKLSDDSDLKKIVLTIDKTYEQRVLYRKLRVELMERRNAKEDVIIFRDQVILRKDKVLNMDLNSNKR